MQRLRQPTIVGEILAGLLVGPAVFGLVEPSEVLEVFAELGVVFLLFWVGLETRLSELRAVGSAAVSVGVLGVVVPFAGGIALDAALGESTATSLFIGAALVATSVGITSACSSTSTCSSAARAARSSAPAIVDDILALLLVAVAAGVAAEGGVDVGSIAVTAAVAVAFVGFIALGGTKLLAARPALLHAPRFSESPLLPAVIICLGPARAVGADRPGRDHRRVYGRDDRRRCRCSRRCSCRRCCAASPSVDGCAGTRRDRRAPPPPDADRRSA